VGLDVMKYSVAGVPSPSHQYQTGAAMARPSGLVVASQMDRPARSLRSTVAQGM
jgi:hypothetical protein